MRDIETQPYSADEKRVAEWFFSHGVGGGDDPIGSLIASHEYVVAQRNRYRGVLNSVISGLAVGKDAVDLAKETIAE